MYNVFWSDLVDVILGFLYGLLHFHIHLRINTICCCFALSCQSTVCDFTPDVLSI